MEFKVVEGSRTSKHLSGRKANRAGSNMEL